MPGFDVIRGAALQGYVEAAQAVGLHVPTALRDAGLPLTVLDDPEAFLAYRAFVGLLEVSALRAGCPDFGMRLAQCQRAYLEGPLTLLMRHAASLNDALALGAQYGYVFSPAMRVSLAPVPQSPALVDLVLNVSAGAGGAGGQTAEFILLGVVHVLQWLAGPVVQPVEVLLPHAAISSEAQYQRFFGCHVRAAATFAAVRLRMQDLSVALPQHNPLLLQMAQSYIEQRYGAGQPTLAERVRRLLRQRLALGQISQVAIAEAVALHPKTLQRRLVGEGVRFDALVEAVRRDRFLELLAQPTRPNFTQIAFMLGYAEPAVLVRSCQRWFGCSPGTLRRRFEAGAGVPVPQESGGAMREVASGTPARPGLA